MTPDLWKFAQDNVLLIAVAAVSGGMLLWPLVRGAGGGGASLGTLEATQLINREDALMLDVRDAQEFAKAHVINARNVPLGQLEARLRDIEKHKRKPVIVYCERGNRSSGAAATLRGKGFEKVFTLAGGMEAWRQAGLPLETG
jgi:rhodanese-related sulfurtransferase